ncbi:B57 [Murid betaherpesvirus 8]|uniref:B57 n=1 Tax=Rat cytomegalovirus (isolate England) TaxID=1261657 RepID=A0A0E3SWT4_RCMVE|nr:B57 [Murid betaherpesvirus 8]WPH24976.1 B57 [Murid betaherpesvirus 8]WPH25110.1 B57 [Murid betaherpesvirus 8]
MAEEDLSTLAPVAPAAWLFLMKKNRQLAEIIATLSICDKGTSVVVAPLLIDLTVDRDFCGTVRTPMSTYEGGVLTKVTSFCPFAFVFHNTLDILAEIEDHGDVQRLCEDARRRFGVQSFVPLQRRCTDMNELCERLNVSADDYVGHVVVGNGLKELLYAGQLIPCVDEAVSCRIGLTDGVKIPLYPATLFTGDGNRVNGTDSTLSCDDSFVLDNALYSPELSEAMFYYLFTSWGQSLRVSDTQRLIEAGLQQFVEDTQQTVKLAAFKKYHGYCSQKLSAVERDQLMTIDAVCCELAFTFASVYLDSVYDTGPSFNFSEWPLVKSAKDHEQLIARLVEFKMHLSTHIAALFFSSNSILYQTRIVYLPNTSKAATTTSTQDVLLKSVRFYNGMTGLYEDALTDAKKTMKFDGDPCRDDKYSPYHLAYFCGTSPQLVSSIIWFFNRMAVYSTGVTGGESVYNHIINSVSNLCSACGGRCCHTCYSTAFVRMSTRLPSIPKQIKKEPAVVSLVSRAFADADLLGNYGRKSGLDMKDSGDASRVDEASAAAVPGGLNFVTVDRIKYISQILDYCKKNSLIDSTTGEDIVNVRSKKDFIATVSALNSCIDDSVCKFAMDVRRSGHGREEISGSTQSFNLDLNPYTMSFSPVFAYQYYRTIFSIIQNLALINAVSYVVDNPLTTTQISRWLGSHFQSICGAFGTTPLKKGFLNVKDVKNQKAVEFEKLMDFRSYYETKRYHKISTEIKSCKMSVQSLRSCRIKNRPISKGGKNAQTSIFFKRGAVQRKNPIKGCLSFLLYRCHDKMFSGVNMSCLEFWQRVFQNSLPTSIDVGKREEFESLIKFLLSATDEYDECDVVDVQPDCILNYVENRFHNRFLSMFGLKDYVSTIQGMTTRLTAQNHMHFPYILTEAPKFMSVAEYVTHFKKIKIEGVKPPVVATVARESVLKTVFENRSLVSVSFAIEKFASTMTTRDIFQFGQIGYFVGCGVERSLNVGSASSQDYRFMRHRYVLATKLVDVIIRRSRRENVLYDVDVLRSRVLAALDSSGVDADPELLAISEIMDGREGEIPELDDILFFVDQQEFIANSLYGKMRALVDRGVTDFSINSLKEAMGASADISSHRDGGNTYDFSSLFDKREDVDEVTAGLVNGDDVHLDDGFELPSKRSRL